MTTAKPRAARNPLKTVMQANLTAAIRAMQAQELKEYSAGFFVAGKKYNISIKQIV